MRYANMIAVAKGSVTEDEKKRVVEQFEDIGCNVVFLEFSSTAGIVPQLHTIVAEPGHGE